MHHNNAVTLGHCTISVQKGGCFDGARLFRVRNKMILSRMIFQFIAFLPLAAYSVARR